MEATLKQFMVGWIDGDDGEDGGFVSDGFAICDHCKTKMHVGQPAYRLNTDCYRDGVHYSYYACSNTECREQIKLIAVDALNEYRINLEYKLKSINELIVNVGCVKEQ